MRLSKPSLLDTNNLKLILEISRAYSKIRKILRMYKKTRGIYDGIGKYR